MEIVEQFRVDVMEASAAGHARGLAAELAQRAGFSATDVERARLVVTEAATNIVKHAGGGELLLHLLEADGRRGVGMLALDKGPGVASLAEAMRDGYTTAGSSGTGLGAVRRLSTLFDVYTAPEGVALLSVIWPDPPDLGARGLIVGGINVPHPGETVSGDAWALSRGSGRWRVLMADGLGHGFAAAAASAAAVEAFRRAADRSPAEALQGIHHALRPTRGAAVAVAEVDRGRGVVRFAGLGNIAGTILADGATRSVVSQHGTAGHDVRRIQEFTYPWDPAGVLVLHSDGLVSHWTLDRHPGLTLRHPMLVAGVLYRDFRRGRDDASVVVLREAPS